MNVGHRGRIARIAAILLIGIVAIFVVLGVGQQDATGSTLLLQAPPTASPPPRANPGAATPEPWPPFTMVYREVRTKPGTNEPPQTQVIRLEYTDQRHWRNTILENRSVPESVGSWSGLSGLASKAYDAKLKRTTDRTYAPDEPINAPADWLIPGKTQILAGRPEWVRIPSTGLGPGLSTIRSETALPNGQRATEEYTYRLDNGIPIRRLQTVNGAEVERKEAVDFSLRTR